MRDDRLKELLRSATDDVHATDRLDELLARRRPGRRRAIVGLVAAAAVVVVLAVVVGLQRDAGPQRISTIRPPETTTTGIGGPRVGDEIAIAEATLPDSVRLLDELPRSIGVEYTVVSRFAETDEIWNGNGPYIRVTLSREDNLGTTWSAEDRGTTDLEIGGRPAFLSTDLLAEAEELVPTDSSAEFAAPWLTLAWSPRADEVIQVQAKGVDPEAMIALARSIRIRR